MENNRKMSYENAKIYKIINTINPKCYVGSTTQSLTQRICEHRSKFNKGKGLYTSKYLFEEDYDGCEIILIEKYPCNDKEELKRREREWIEKLDCVNRCIPGRTKQEYKETHKEEKKATDKAYYERNKDIINNKNKEYQRTNKEKLDTRRNEVFQCQCGATVLFRNSSRHQRAKKHIDYVNSK